MEKQLPNDNCFPLLFKSSLFFLIYFCVTRVHVSYLGLNLSETMLPYPDLKRGKRVCLKLQKTVEK